MPPFEDWFPVQATNIQGCLEITASAKKEFLDAINSAGHATKEDARADAVARFRAKKLAGAVTVLNPGERLGRLHEWSAIELTASKLGVPKAALDSYKNQAQAGDMSAVDEIVTCLSSEPFGPLVWCFRNPGPGTPFDVGPASSLPCRLGLEKLDKDDYVPLEVTVPSGLSVRRATAFDAGFNDQWCPGGLTCPRTACLGLSGIPEIVAPGKRVGIPGYESGLAFSDAKAPSAW